MRIPLSARLFLVACAAYGVGLAWAAGWSLLAIALYGVGCALMGFGGWVWVRPDLARPAPGLRPTSDPAAELLSSEQAWGTDDMGVPRDGWSANRPADPHQRIG